MRINQISEGKPWTVMAGLLLGILLFSMASGRVAQYFGWRVPPGRWQHRWQECAGIKVKP